MATRVKGYLKYYSPGPLLTILLFNNFLFSWNVKLWIIDIKLEFQLQKFYCIWKEYVNLDD